MQAQVAKMVDKLEHLTLKRLAEIADFIDFLQQRDQEKQLRQSYTQASVDSFDKVWDNEEDAIYDSL